MTGFLLIDKPQGLTSFDVVARVRRLAHTKKCGHTGTLDPMATGVMVVAVGNCTRFIELIPSHDKEYDASLAFGVRTDSFDVSGNVTERSALRPSKEETERVLSCFVGEITQLPPMFSAVKKDGRRLYELAREGKEVERESRMVRVYSAGITDFDEENGHCSLKISCSSGTYVRTLIDDLGLKLGCFAAMTALRRTMANGVRIENCLSLERLNEMAAEGTLESALMPADSLLAYNNVVVSESQARRFKNGGELDLERIRQNVSGGYCRVYSEDGTFCGIGDADVACGVLNVKRVFQRED